MKILICDYKDSMMPTHDYEERVLKDGMKDVEIIVYEYLDSKRDEFLTLVEDVDAILTAFIPIDKEVFQKAKKLKCISLNATGYDNVDLAEATNRGIGVFPVGEYCTNDVAEHAIALMLSLNKNIKKYIYDIEKKYIWKYDSPVPPNRIENQTIGIFGFGKIGRKVARLAKGLGMTVMIHDLFVDENIAKEIGVISSTGEEIYSNADIISNHMSLKETSTVYFTKTEFDKMKKNPIFLNLGRGKSINEQDLVYALDSGIIRAAGVDVLYDETPVLENHALSNRDNVIITPHSAFYSKESITDLQRMSCQNIVHFMNGDKDKVFKLVNNV